LVAVVDLRLHPFSFEIYFMLLISMDVVVAMYVHSPSGLSVAHALLGSTSTKDDENGDCAVDVWDARPGLDATAGAGIQLNGGLAVLGWLDNRSSNQDGGRSDVQSAVYDAGLPQVRVQSRCKPWTWTDGTSDDNRPKPYDELLQLDLQETVEREGGAVAKALLSGSTGSNGRRRVLWWTSIMRGALQQALYDTLLKTDDHRVTVRFDKRLQSLKEEEGTGSGGGVHCCFADGTTAGPYDLVIGCEGINSPCKSYVDHRRMSSQEGKVSDRTAIYSGLRIRYAVADGDPTQPVEDTATLTQYFGDGAYALSGVYGAGPGQPNTKVVFIVYLDPNSFGPFPRMGHPKTDPSIKVGENADWSQDNRKTVETARRNMLDQLRLAGIPDEELGPIVQSADRFFELGSYFHNPFCKWSRKVGASAHVVLCGDAAHALPPFLGQGSNQAIQDAYCLAERISAYNAQVANGEMVDLQTFLDEYETIRWPATFQIFWKSAFLGYLETGGFDGFYAKFRDLFFKTMGILGVAKKVLLSAAAPKVD
jgi:2-polyprenyl-6-methoxyphenol hydroxylase-like FAD-dependent oxidoreductase